MLYWYQVSCLQSYSLMDDVQSIDTPILKVQGWKLVDQSRGLTFARGQQTYAEVTHRPRGGSTGLTIGTYIFSDGNRCKRIAASQPEQPYACSITAHLEFQNHIHIITQPLASWVPTNNKCFCWYVTFYHRSSRHYIIGCHSTACQICPHASADAT